KRVAIPPRLEFAHLPHDGSLPLGPSQAAHAIPQPAVRRFLQWLGARGLSKHLARRVESFCGKIDPKRQHVFLVGGSTSLACPSLRISRPQDAATSDRISVGYGRLSGFHLVLPPLRRAGDLRDIFAACPSDPSFAGHACCTPPRRACAFV